MDLARLRAAYEQAKGELLAQRTPDGHWVGELSSSALSTATAVSALAVVRGLGSGFRVQEDQASGRRKPPDGMESPFAPEFLDDLIARGVGYLVNQQNPDGGFGDTDLSHSNIATTYLVVAALHLAGVVEQHADVVVRANTYIDSRGRLAGLRERYGIDKTFVVPIMTNLALADLIDWREIDPLPFELACVPQSLYRFVGMPVVSYAIPALVAIGQARYFHAPPRNPFTWLVRWLSITRSLKVLRSMQPDSGGYLEATPLTSFVVMSLASLTKPRPLVEVNDQTAPSRPKDAPATGSDESRASATTLPLAPRPLVGALHPIAGRVIRHGIQFLANSIRPDGSWPIDTNLATWNTTLAINALAGAGEDVAELLGPKCLDWLLSCQHTKRHPFTGADPGGFGWSDLSGAVPDADDTPGALLAIAAHRIGHQGYDMDYRELDGFDWLVRLQNRNGGWPTFCRGWGRLPFDRSGTDLTAHVLRALQVWASELDQHDFWPLDSLRDVMIAAMKQGREFLDREQHPDGSWSPLWFGNQDHPTEDNPVYGTAKVLMAYRDLGLMDSPEAQRGVAWLVARQNADGGWGSGVRGKGRRTKDEGRNGSAELGSKAGVESARGVTGPGGTGHSVPGAEYSVPSTQYSVACSQNQSMPTSRPELSTPSPQPLVPNSLTSSVEETALAVEALLAALNPEPRTLNPAAAVARGLAWLIDRVEAGQHRQPAPIGFYFAKLWYYESLYPLTFTVAALGRACRAFAHPASTGTTPWTTAAP